MHFVILAAKLVIVQFLKIPQNANNVMIQLIFYQRFQANASFWQAALIVKKYFIFTFKDGVNSTYSGLGLNICVSDCSGYSLS